MSGPASVPELPARLAGRLSADVPERDVERADRVDAAAPPAGHRGADVEVFPDRLRVERVAADQLLLEPAVHGVRRRRLDERARHPGVQIGFADPDEALVGDHLDDDRVLRRARRAGVVARIEQHVRSDVDDLHVTPCCRRRRSRYSRLPGSPPRPRTRRHRRRRPPRRAEAPDGMLRRRAASISVAGSSGAWLMFAMYTAVGGGSCANSACIA